MKIYHRTGQGKFTNSEGNEINYPINKLVMRTSKGEMVVALDPTNKKLLPFLIDKSGDPIQTHDEHGNVVTETEIA